MSQGSGVEPVRMSLRVLVVCTGNVCRSPAAELLLRHGLGAATDVTVASAGLAALVGEPVAEPMTQLLRARGVDPAGFTAQQLQSTAVRDADLVLTMTAAQRRAVVTSVPSAVRRTFTLVEFADVAALAEIVRLPGGPAERLAAALRAAPRARALRLDTAADDIEDPYGRSSDVFARSFGSIDTAVGRLIREIDNAATGPVALTPRDADRILPALTRSGGDTR